METINDLLQEYYQFKKAHSPYDYREWRVGGDIARQCKEILDKIGETVKTLLVSHAILQECDFKVVSPDGVGYYPKSPWIGVLVKSETVTNGVYPILGFYNDSSGCYIGCVESYTNPQLDFQRRYCTDEGLSEGDKRKLAECGLDKDTHLARMPTIVPAHCELNEEILIRAWTDALRIRNEYRNDFPSESINWYKEIRVDDLSQWLNLISCYHTAGNEESVPPWIYRGQGDSMWNLESSFYRRFEGINDSGILNKIETQSMNNFKREMYGAMQYQRFSGVNLLAVMQHYGSVTRLLDFTFSPLIALFFALDQREELVAKLRGYSRCHGLPQDVEDNNISLVVWAFNILSILKGDGKDVDLNDVLAKSTQEAHEMVLHRGGNVSKGINVVLPKFGNERLSAQSGLFLMAQDIGLPFEENLRAALPHLNVITRNDCGSEEISAMINGGRTAVMKKFDVVKFVFPEKQVHGIKRMLKSLRITYKAVYPDLVGIARNATEEI